MLTLSFTHNRTFCCRMSNFIEIPSVFSPTACLNDAIDVSLHVDMFEESVDLVSIALLTVGREVGSDTFFAQS